MTPIEKALIQGEALRKQFEDAKVAATQRNHQYLAWFGIGFIGGVCLTVIAVMS